MNAEKLMDNEWIDLRKNNSCWNNACVHTYSTRMDPRDFAVEMENTNILFKSKQLPVNLKCKVYADYRMTSTPIQNFKVNNENNK